MATRKRTLVGLGTLGAALAYFAVWPIAIDPVAWAPSPAPPAEGGYAPNSRLTAVERLGETAVAGAEDVAVDAAGFVYGGGAGGAIVRLAPDGTGASVFASTGGRPAGLRFDALGNLVVCDAVKGLLSVGPDGAISELGTEANGLRFGLCDDLDIAEDGTIYFTDASWKFGIDAYELDILEHGGNGRFLAYDPATRETRVLVEGLNFPNGVAVSPDQAFVLVAVTGEYRVLRYWLEGERRGATDVFVENLPGMPDGILANGRGGYWVALASPRSALLDAMAPYPFARRAAARLPLSWFPRPKPAAYVVGLDAQGRVVETLQDASSGAYAPVTNAVEHDGVLYLGSLEARGIGRLRLR